MVVGDQTPKAALRRVKRVLRGWGLDPKGVYPFRVYSNDTLVTIDRDELILILEDYEELMHRMAGLEK